jgi:hypothetical protein
MPLLLEKASRLGFPAATASTDPCPVSLFPL